MLLGETCIPFVFIILLLKLRSLLSIRFLVYQSRIIYLLSYLSRILIVKIKIMKLLVLISLIICAGLLLKLVSIIRVCDLWLTLNKVIIELTALLNSLILLYAFFLFFKLTIFLINFRFLQLHINVFYCCGYHFLILIYFVFIYFLFFVITLLVYAQILIFIINIFYF